MTLRAIDYVSLIIYFAFVLGIGWLAKRRVKTSEDFLTSRHSVPVWITSLAFIAANLGAQEMIGMCASGAKYGIMTVHFYWLGAVPAMVFVGLFMMPFYYGSRARSVPEYLALRFDEKTRGLNAITFAVMTIFSSGISMYALGLLFELVLKWNFTNSVLLSAAIVLIYTLLGGLTSAIYNEVVQFFLIVLGFAPLSILAVQKAGGWGGISSRLQPVMTHSWRYTVHASENPMGVEIFGLVAGLGFVLSFGYWCTNFLVIQRAMAAQTMQGARQTPLIAAFPKILMPFVVILPGIAAVALMSMSSGYTLPLDAHGGYDYNQVLTTLMAKFYPSGMLGIGLTALMASFMSGMAGNVTAFNTVFTYDLYQGYVVRNAPDRHYLMGRPRDHGSGSCVVGGHRLPCDLLQQHHGFFAARVRFRERAVVCDVFVGNVLETRHRARSILGDGYGAARRVLYTGAYGRGEQRRMVRQSSPIPFGDGAEFLDCHYRVDRVPDCDGCGEPGQQAETGIRTSQPGIRRNGSAESGECGLVQAPRASRHHRAGRAGDLQHYFLVMDHG